MDIYSRASPLAKDHTACAFTHSPAAIRLATRAFFDSEDCLFTTSRQGGVSRLRTLVKQDAGAGVRVESPRKLAIQAGQEYFLPGSYRGP